MSLNIGALTMLLEADGSKLLPQIVKEAEKAGDAAGKKMGATMAGQFKSAAGLAVRGLGAALATLGAGQLLQLDKAMAEFRRETGATATEAREAGKAINELSGKNLQGIEEIGRAMAKVRTDLGVTDPLKLKEITQNVLSFARVTGVDAADAVKSFDDALDAWGLTVEDLSGLMDQLVVSQQKFGGSVDARLAALTNLAPAMKALNFSIDDSIALLNLFETKGLDAAATQRAFNTAVKNLPPGTNLKGILEGISKIEDPSKRAAEAIRIFGSRGGVALANALAPGIGALGDYAVSAEDSVGATKKAADASLSFVDHVKLAVKGLTSTLGELGLTDLGPLILGLTTLGSLGGGKLVGALLKPFGTLAAPLKAAVLNAVVGAIGGSIVPAGAAGVVVGEATGKGVATGISRSSGLVRAAAIGLLAGFTLVIPIAFELQSAEAKRLLKEIASNVTIGIGFGKGITEEQIEAIRRQLKVALGSVDDETRPFVQEQSDLFEGFVRGVIEDVKDGSSAIGHWGASGAAALGKATADGLTNARAKVASAAYGMTEPILAAMLSAEAGARAIAARTPGEIADALRSKRNIVKDSMALLLSTIKENKGREDAKILGFLVGGDLANALKSKDPLIRNQALATKKALLDGLSEILPANGQLGRKAQDELNKALKSKDPAVRRQAEATKKLLEAGLKPDTKTIGDKSVDEIRTALNDGSTEIGRAANALGILIANEILRGIKGLGVAKTVKRGSSGAAQDPQDTRPPAPTGGSGGGFIKRAGGGDYEAGDVVLTGEDGPELDLRRYPGTVIPHGATVSIMRGLAAFMQSAIPRPMVGALAGVTTPAPGAGQGFRDVHVNVQGLLPVRSAGDVVREFHHAIDFAKKR